LLKFFKSRGALNPPPDAHGTSASFRKPPNILVSFAVKPGRYYICFKAKTANTCQLRVLFRRSAAKCWFQLRMRRNGKHGLISQSIHRAQSQFTVKHAGHIKPLRPRKKIRLRNTTSNGWKHTHAYSERRKPNQSPCMLRFVHRQNPQRPPSFGARGKF